MNFKFSNAGLTNKKSRRKYTKHGDKKPTKRELIYRLKTKEQISGVKDTIHKLTY